VALADSADETFAQLARVARRLAEPVDVLTELAKSARRDPLSGVRVRCLRTVLREYPQHAGVKALLREAVGDPDAEVRLEAATALGPDGLAVLGALVGDPGVEDDVAVRAAEALGQHLPAETARVALRREQAAARGDRRPATARACAAALGRAGNPQDEPLLLAIAREERDESLRVAAVRALGLVGTAQAVPALAALADSAGGDLRRAGREAIAAIQSRLKGATPGQLSLHAGGAGQVALADDPTGRVSDASAEED
jgi:HEAT repeat protein